MAEHVYTPEIIKAALTVEERIQYNALLDILLSKKILNPSEQKKYDDYKAKINKYIDGQAAASSGRPPSGELDEPGIPVELRVRRRYTMSPEALAQRKAAGNSPAKSDSMKGNRNGWKHGRYADDFINKIKPCKSTCPQYPCSLVSEGEVEPGDDCLDKVEVIKFFRAVHNAVKDKNYDDFNELAALQIANTIKVIDMLIEDIIRDGTVLKREKHDAKDNLIVEYVTHPSLLALPKLIADLGLNPTEFMITPRAIARDKNERDVGKTLAEMMSRAGRGLKKKDHEEDD
jgi:hypothetical protein